MNKKDFSERLKNLGVKVYKKAQTELKNLKMTAEQTVLNDKLRRRFNLENPYKFLILNDNDKQTFLNRHVPRNAKRYNEDDVFVFYGDVDNSGITKEDYIKDLSDETEYEVIEVIEVSVPVKYEDKVYDVPCTAVYGKMRS